MTDCKERNADSGEKSPGLERSTGRQKALGKSAPKLAQVQQGQSGNEPGNGSQPADQDGDGGGVDVEQVDEAPKVGKKKNRVPRAGDRRSESTSFAYRAHHVWRIQNAKFLVVDPISKLSEKSDRWICPVVSTFLVGPEAPSALAPRHNRWMLRLEAAYDKTLKKATCGFYLLQEKPYWGPVMVDIKWRGPRGCSGSPAFQCQDTIQFGDGRGWGFPDDPERLWCEYNLYNPATDTIEIAAGVQVPALDSAAVDLPGITTFDLAPTYQKLFEDAHKHADVTIETSDGVHLPAHRLILRARSPFFDLLFSQPMQEHLQSKVTVSGNETVVRAMLHYIYTGKTCGVAQSVVKLEDMVSVFKLAQMYELPELAQVSASALLKRATVQNVVELLHVATTHATPPFAPPPPFARDSKSERSAPRESPSVGDVNLCCRNNMEQCAEIAQHLVARLQDFLRQHAESFISALPALTIASPTATGSLS